MADSALQVAAVDIGAESGRVMVGSLDGEHVTLTAGHRFANRSVWLPDGLHWDLLGVLCEIQTGLRAVASNHRISSIGIDTWGCDYGLLDASDRLLGQPYHYRDARTAPEVLAVAHARVDRAELYRRTGIQTMPINTIFQLVAEAATESPTLANAQRIALIPDLLGLWLTGTLVNELTIASTTGLLQADGRRWANDLVARLGLPARPFQGTVAPPGLDLGPLLDRHHDAVGTASGAVVRTVAGHDTASAFVAAPLHDQHGAVLSSGTWSLLGVELSEPELGPDAALFNLTNERGIDGTVRLLRNVMGLWLVQETRRALAAGGAEYDYEELGRLAADARPDVALFDPDHGSLLRGVAMPDRIAALCTGTGQTPPQSPGELIRSILTSLACKYRLVLDRLIYVSGRRIDTVHVVGGGARNALLCQLTADLLQRPVLAGPAEATALGNVLVQAAAAGEVSGLSQMRALVRASKPPERYEPSRSVGSEIYERFARVTGLSTTLATHGPLGAAH